jgi:hypothetical protein
VRHCEHVAAVDHEDAEQAVVEELARDTDRDRPRARDLAHLARDGVAAEQRTAVDPNVDRDRRRLLRSRRSTR